MISSKLKHHPLPHRSMLLLLILAVSLLTSSCVYFNTFYNARKYFDSAQSQPVPETGRPPARAIQDYDKVIQRCTYILREYPHSKWADDALYLLARSVFYQRRNVLQAKERFQDLLRAFPDSPYVPGSMLYIARIEYQLNNRDAAFRMLNNILLNDTYQDYFPRVLLLRSDWYMKEQNHEIAQRDLNRIITDFRRTEQFELALLKLGTSYLDNENYTESKQLFESIIASRVSRRIRFDARYYVALSNFYLQEYDTVIRQASMLIRDEYEQNLFPRLYLLQARTYAAQKKYVEAEELFKRIMEENRRTLISAEASYHLANMYFLDLKDNEQALEYFNYVSAESRTSPFVQKAMGRSSVVSQLIQLNRSDGSMKPVELIQEQFKLAEYYLYVMNLPDSALSVYNNVATQTEKLRERKVSLQNQLEEALVEEQAAGEAADADSLTVTEPEPVEDIDDYEPGLDDEKITITELETVQAKENESELLIAELAVISESIELYQIEYVAYSMFMTSWVQVNMLNNHSKAQAVLEKMQEHYPDHRYTYATRRLLAGEEIVLAHPIELEKEAEYGQALSLIKTDTETGLAKLNSLLASIDDIIGDDTHTPYPRLQALHQQTLYALGFTYYFDLQDSTSARSYFEELLIQAPESTYSKAVRTFYANNHFIVADSLSIPTPVKEEAPVKDEPNNKQMRRPSDALHETPIEDIDGHGLFDRPFEPEFGQ